MLHTFIIGIVLLLIGSLFIGKQALIIIKYEKVRYHLNQSSFFSFGRIFWWILLLIAVVILSFFLVAITYLPMSSPDLQPEDVSFLRDVLVMILALWIISISFNLAGYIREHELEKATAPLENFLIEEVEIVAEERYSNTARKYHVEFDSPIIEDIKIINTKVLTMLSVNNQIDVLKQKSAQNNAILIEKASKKNQELSKEIKNRVDALINTLKVNASNPLLEWHNAKIKGAQNVLNAFVSNSEEPIDEKQTFLSVPLEVLELQSIIAHKDIPNDLKEQSKRVLTAIEQKQEVKTRKIEMDELIVNAKTIIDASKKLHGITH